MRATSAPHWQAVTATSYCQSGVTASGQYTLPGEVAMNIEPLGTHIIVSPAVFERTHYVVLDRIGYGTQLDFYTVRCSDAVTFGRRVIHYHIALTGR